MTVGRSAPRYQIMALLYPRSKILPPYLSEYFLVVVRLCHEFLKLTKRSSFGQLISFPGESDMRAYQLELDQWAQMIKEEVNLLMAQNVKEQSSGVKALLRFSDSGSYRQMVKARVRVLDFCSTYDHQIPWKAVRKIGNATLFHRTPEYQDWKARDDSCTLVFKGKLGSGKSVLLANIVDDLNLHVRSLEPVAYFFCRHDISNSLKATTVIGSLARQLLGIIPDLSLAEKAVDGITSSPDFEAILGVLQQALPSNFKAYFVLDGLDECDDLQKRTIIRQLRDVQKVFTLRICASFRLDANNILRPSPKQFVEQYAVTTSDENPDIGDFISTELERCIESGKLTIGDPTLILRIEDALLQ